MAAKIGWGIFSSELSIRMKRHSLQHPSRQHVIFFEFLRGNNCMQRTVPTKLLIIKYHHFTHLFYFSEWITPYREKHFVSDVPFIDSHCHLDFLFKRKNYTASLYGYLQAGGDKIATQTTPPNFAGCLAIFCDPVFWSQGWSNGVNFFWV